MIFGDLLLRLVIIYALILAGVVLKWFVRGVGSLTRTLSILLINFLFPVAVFASITQFSEAFGDLRISIFSASIFFFSSIVAYIVFKFLREGEKTVGPFILASILPNGFYLPFPIVYALHGVEGLSCSTLFLFIANIVTAFYIYPLYSYYSSGNQNKGVKLIRTILLFPPFIASVLGFVFLGFGFTLPRVIVQPLSYFGQLTTYLALFFVGLNVNLKGNGWFSKPILGVVATRLVALPLVIFGLMKSLGLKEVWSMVIIIHSGMPPAVNNIFLADHFGLDKKLMATIVTACTALSLLTLPLLMYLGENL